MTYGDSSRLFGLLPSDGPTGLMFALPILCIVIILKLYIFPIEKYRFQAVSPALVTKSTRAESENLRNQLPPSRRRAVISEPNEKSEKYRNVLNSTEATDAMVLSCQLSSTAAPGQTGLPSYTPTGFSLADIERIGSFPDYSVLSGVPHPKPCPAFDLTTACFRPFRPFRWAYHQTMSLSRMEPDFWIELEKNYFDSLKQRKALLNQHGARILNQTPGSELACRELMEMVLQYLCIRYPGHFSLEESNTVFLNWLLGSKTNLTNTPPLQVLFDNVPEDFAIMMRNEKDGLYYLRAGFICSSIGWTFGTHFNRPLRAIHTEVNDYHKMAKSMDRYFSKMPTDNPIQRGAWFVEDWKALFVTPEEYAQNAGTRHQGEVLAIDQCYLRVDWQTLRRLPLSGAIVFNFKAIFTPMTELRDEPYIPSLLYKQVAEGKRLITEPKVHKHLRPVVLRTLQEWKEEQIRNGLVPPDWEEGTLAETPFYPGWEEKWRHKLGFDI